MVLKSNMCRGIQKRLGRATCLKIKRWLVMWHGLAVRAPVNTATNSRQISWFFTFLWDAPNENPVHFWMFAHFFFFILFSIPLLLRPWAFSLQDYLCKTWWPGNVTIPLQLCGKEVFIGHNYLRNSISFLRWWCDSWTSSNDPFAASRFMDCIQSFSQTKSHVHEGME